jgi:hypothetical protein
MVTSDDARESDGDGRVRTGAACLSVHSTRGTVADGQTDSERLVPGLMRLVAMGEGLQAARCMATGHPSRIVMDAAE